MPRTFDANYWSNGGAAPMSNAPRNGGGFGAQPPFQQPNPGMGAQPPFQIPGGPNPGFGGGPTQGGPPPGWELDPTRLGGVRPWDPPGFDPTNGGPFYRPQASAPGGGGWPGAGGATAPGGGGVPGGSGGATGPGFGGGPTPVPPGMDMNSLFQHPIFQQFLQQMGGNAGGQTPSWGAGLSQQPGQMQPQSPQLTIGGLASGNQRY